jgi:dihydroorotase
VTAEVTPHHLVLTEDAVLGAGDGGLKAYDTLAKVNPPLRTRADVEACIEGLAQGVIDCIATDHAPHASEDKLCEFDVAAFGISGLETAFGLVSSLVGDGRLTLNELIERLTIGPTRALGLDRLVPKIGSIGSGASADVAIIDPDHNWVVEPEKFASKGKNTPIAGWTLKGRVMATVARGRLVWNDLKSSEATREEATALG